MEKTRDEALNLLERYIKQENMLKHCLASEAVMRAIARRLGEDVDLWGMAGLLHDLDVEITHADPRIHGLKAAEILAKEGYPELLVDAVKMHNEDATGMERNTVFQHALAAGETIPGLVIATTLVYPDKKLSSVKPKSVTKRMKEKAFAASVRRDHILECEKIGIPMPEFSALAVEAMREIADVLGL